jgi:hypothetical protein
LASKPRVSHSCSPIGHIPRSGSVITVTAHTRPV